MARYADDSKEKVRDAVDFVDLVGSRVELRKAGVRRYTGLCPFHEERSPSFGIDPLEKVYHCFGCGAGGDVFQWVMDIENLGFVEALEVLADRYNVPLERTDEDPRAAERRARQKRLMAVLERAAAYYVRQLWEAPEAAAARAYLADRGSGRGDGAGVPGRLLAVVVWDKLVGASQRAGFSADDLLAVGLAQRSRGRSGLIDRFRGRLMFPWADERGRVLGFGARALSADQQPKYLNTSETDIFHKGGQVYGADIARVPAAKAGTVVLVEGYTDVLAFHQAGVQHTVGQQGTALTKDQASALTRLASRVVLCLDADSAGREAMLKAATVVRSVKADADLRVVRAAGRVRPGGRRAAGGGRGGLEAVGRGGPVRALAGRVRARPRGHEQSRGARGAAGRGPRRHRAAQQRHRAPGADPDGCRPARAQRRAAGVDVLAAGPAARRRPRRRGSRRRPSAGERVRWRRWRRWRRGRRARRADRRRSGPRGGEPGTPRARPARGGGARVSRSLCIALPSEGARRLADLDLDALFAGSSPAGRPSICASTPTLPQPASRPTTSRFPP